MNAAREVVVERLALLRSLSASQQRNFAEKEKRMNKSFMIRKAEESDRIILDEFFIKDEEVLKELYRPANAESWVHPRRKLLEETYPFTIVADGEVVGEISLEGRSICHSTYTVGFGVGRQYWNRGYCTEALKQLVKFAFDDLKLHKLVGDNDSDNPASGRVFEKAGFAIEGILKEQVYKRGRYIDRTHWGLINPSPESR